MEPSVYQSTTYELQKLPITTVLDCTTAIIT